MKLNFLQKAWIKAMASGRYRQGVRSLARKTESRHVYYCCLGVACVVSNKLHKKHGTPNIRVSVSDKNLFSYDGDTAVLPDRLVDKLDLHDNEGKFLNKARIGGETYDSLMDMNDSKVPHKVIAKYILDNPKNVFFLRA